MWHIIKFCWNSSRGHRFTPWRSPYLKWRLETYTGMKMKSIGFFEFWGIMFRERNEMLRYLRWTVRMDGYAKKKRPAVKPSAAQ